MWSGNWIYAFPVVPWDTVWLIFAIFGPFSTTVYSGSVDFTLKFNSFCYNKSLRPVLDDLSNICLKCFLQKDWRKHLLRIIAIKEIIFGNFCFLSSGSFVAGHYVLNISPWNHTERGNLGKEINNICPWIEHHFICLLPQPGFLFYL